MRRFLLVAIHEYTRLVFRKQFFFGVFGPPVFLACALMIVIFAFYLSEDRRPVGIVDEVTSGSHSKILEEVLSEQKTQFVDFILFPDQQSARSALLTGNIQAYYVINPEYPENPKVTLISLETTGSLVRSQFEKIMRFTLLYNQKPEIVKRIMEGSHLTIISMERTKQMAENHWLKALIPILIGGFFLLTINTSGTYLLHAIVEEKENRTIEILVTSISPTQLMAGKMAGNLSVGLTIILIYALAASGVIVFGTMFLFPDIPKLIDWKLLAPLSLLILPALILVASWITLIGSTVAEVREASQITGFISFFLNLPIWFSYTLLFYPNSVVSIVLSLIPLTSPLAFPIRASFTTIPVWQWFLTYFLMYGSTGISIWLAGKAFRLGMVRYGKKTLFIELFRKKSNHE